jgi:tetratricopeptide (TPR) repeat protein
MEKRREMKKFVFIVKIFLFSGFLAFSIISTTSGTAGQAEKRLQNVLLITIDTLRADRLSCYSTEHLRTPNIDKLAERGVLFSRTFAHTSTTLPSHTNILCGTTPLHHGIHDNFNFVLDEEYLTLAEHLKTIGYTTGAFIGGFPLDARFGLDQGFDIYDDDFGKTSELEIRAEFVVDKALSWLKHQENPWFLWIHNYDPHDPYEPPEPFLKKYENDVYNGEVAYVDHVLGRLYDYLETNGLFGSTLVVFTGDHGEALGQHGEVTHGFFAYNEVIWVPLIICSPELSKDRIDQYVSHVDIFPTVCDLLDIKKPAFLQGISLTPAIKGKKIPSRAHYFESLYPFYGRGWAPLRGFIQKGEKFIDSPIPEFYEIEKDFFELNNLAKMRKLENDRKQLDRIMNELSNSETPASRRTIDKEALRKLESLGYISNPNLVAKENFGPEDDIKTLLPLYNKANLTTNLYKKGEISINGAMESLKEVLSDTQQIDIAYQGLGSLYREMGRLDDAIEVLRQGIEYHPSSFEILRDLVRYLSETGKHQEVISICNDIYVVQMEFEADIWNFLGYAYWKTGDLERAVETYEKAVAIDNENPSLLSNFGNIYLSMYPKTGQQNHLERAIDLFARSIELDPGNAQAHFGLGMAYLGSHDIERAIVQWEKGIELKPDDIMTLFNLGRAYFEKGDRVKALDYLMRLKNNFFHRIPAEMKQTVEDLIKKCKEQPSLMSSPRKNGR